ncbi:MAG: branched-chain amino acid ABC transporter permease [Promethearchaeota archaeon]
MIEEILIFGTVQGALLALFALGFSLVYGVGGVLNLSHGAFFVIAVYVFYWTIPLLGVAISAALALIAVVAVGAATYLALIKPLQESHIGVVLVTFALAFFIEQFVKVVGDSLWHYIPPYIPLWVEPLGVRIRAQEILLVVGSLILVTVVALFISKSRIGKSIRAVSQDAEAAKLMGINTDFVLMTSVMLSALLVGFAAILFGPGSSIAPHLGWGYLLSAFAVTIFGGMGSIPGSILGAFIMGYAGEFTEILISASFSEVVPIVVILVMLLVRPQGLLGKKELQ